MWIDYHVHSDNSFDCKTPMEQMCARALTVGLAELAFTDHLNNHLLDIDLGYYDPERFFTDIERCQSQFPRLTIRAGIEVGEPHRWGEKILPVLESYPYDVVLGSLHWIGNTNVFDPNYYWSRTPQQAFNQYLAELAAMTRHGGFDILAHFDVPRYVGPDVYEAFDSDCGDYEGAVRAVWQACIDNQIAPEINTRGFRYRLSQFHLPVEALRWYAEMGGERLTLGSDAHQPDSLGSYFDQARQSAIEAGLARICRFERRALVEWITL
jgi:histidinol-phosphatase (PHP family)